MKDKKDMIAFSLYIFNFIVSMNTFPSNTIPAPMETAAVRSVWILSMVQISDFVKICSLTMFAESGPVGNRMFPRAQLCRRYNGVKQEPVDFHRKSKAQACPRCSGVSIDTPAPSGASSFRVTQLRP